MGSDLAQRPSTSTLIVARQHRSLRVYFDDVWWAGVCRQDAESSLSSTLVRSFIQRGAVPANYGLRAKTLLSEWVGAPLHSEAVPQLTVRLLTATSDQTYMAEPRGRPQRAKAKAKAEPVSDRAPHLSEQQLEATYGLGFRLLKNMGPVATNITPLVGVVRQGRQGVRDDERGADPMVTLASSSSATPQVADSTAPLPKQMPRRRALDAAAASSSAGPTQVLPERSVVVEVQEADADPEQVVDVVESSSSSSSSDFPPDTPSFLRGTRGYIRVLEGQERERRDLYLISLAMSRAKNPAYYGGDYVDSAPYVRAAMFDVIKKVCGVHDEQVYQLLRMLPYGQLSLFQSDLDFGHKLTTRIYAELCSQRNWPLLLRADITLPLSCRSGSISC
eukprot:590230-Amphidinium_carterae.2